MGYSRGSAISYLETNEDEARENCEVCTDIEPANETFVLHFLALPSVWQLRVKSHCRPVSRKRIGVPYTDGDIETAAAEVDGKTEEDAMVAYLQVLGTMAPLNDETVYRE